MIIETINCACYDRDHILRVSFDEETQLFSFEFIVGARARYYDSIIHKILWRIKNTIKILFIGSIKMEEEWLLKKEEIEKLMTFLQQ